VSLGCGLIALARSEARWKWWLGRLETAGFLSSIVLMLLAAGVAFSSTKEMLKSAGWVSHTQEVLKEIGEAASGMAALESAQRGYLITGEEDLLAAREATKTAVRDDFAALRKLTSDNPSPASPARAIAAPPRAPHGVWRLGRSPSAGSKASLPPSS